MRHKIFTKAVKKRKKKGFHHLCENNKKLPVCSLHASCIRAERLLACEVCQKHLLKQFRNKAEEALNHFLAYMAFTSAVISSPPMRFQFSTKVSKLSIGSTPIMILSIISSSAETMLAHFMDMTSVNAG